MFGFFDTYKVVLPAEKSSCPCPAFSNLALFHHFIDNCSNLF